RPVDRRGTGLSPGDGAAGSQLGLHFGADVGHRPPVAVPDLLPDAAVGARSHDAASGLAHPVDGRGIEHLTLGGLAADAFALHALDFGRRVEDLLVPYRSR